jgi:hypothetical protein
MTNDQRDERPGAPGAQGQNPDHGISITSYEYISNRSLTIRSEAPERMPISVEEMDSLTRLLGHLRTRLLWSYCEWAEQARSGRLSTTDLEAKARAAFAGMRHQFVAHLRATLEACPDPIVVEPPPAGDSKLSAE